MNTREVSAFGTLLRRHRQAAGMTQEELAERARLSARAVIDLERGARQVPRRETVQLLAEALALTPLDRAAFEAAARPRPAPVTTKPEAIASGAEPVPSSHATVAAHSGGFLGARPPGPLVGREAELGRVAAALDEAARGRARLLMLAGEPGVGKTRLAQEAVLLAGLRQVWEHEGTTSGVISSTAGVPLAGHLLRQLQSGPVIRAIWQGTAPVGRAGAPSRSYAWRHGNSPALHHERYRSVLRTRRSRTRASARSAP
jgi:transcriptional regulator with XRE-family HTH domain